jgi:hypothetical protein
MRKTAPAGPIALCNRSYRQQVFYIKPSPEAPLESNHIPHLYTKLYLYISTSLHTNLRNNGLLQGLPRNPRGKDCL